MKSSLPALVVAVVLTAAVTWFLTSRTAPPEPAGAANGERQVAYYQCPMPSHPRYPTPQRCTVCGMQTIPFYKGAAGTGDTSSPDTVSLDEHMIQVLHVQTAQAKTQKLVKTLRVAGRIDDDERRHRIISAYTDGRIDKLYANHHGFVVIKGEPLALIYSPTLLAAEREYRQLTGELRRNTALRLRQMGLIPEQIEALDKKPVDELTSQILAPLGGTVVEHNVYEGQYVTAGQKLFEIADFSIMWFQFDAYEQDIPWIKPGLEVEVSTPAVAGKTFTGRTTFIDPNFNETTRSTMVRVELENPVVDGRRLLLHKLYADGLVKLDTPDALAVPRSAVIETGPEAVVYVEGNRGSYVRTPVKTGMRGDALIQITAGLKEGTRVVTNGNLLIDGQAEMNRAFMTAPVEPPKPPPAGAVPAGPPLADDGRKALSDFTGFADSLAAALSADDLPAFNKAGVRAAEITKALTDSL
ncbi:MAG TPA: efflux RND transporter periplasmic adaptor subunit, partial [Verrucomicrobiales bacterium]|nr:efflux RND transporter periplasmic adaptor subunit [Verrucomicrobiales bacterium]